jgi:UPF0176 protein
MVTVAALYHFARLADPAALRDRLLPLCRDGGLRGTLILAGEGVNGTVAGPRDAVLALIAALRAEPGLAALEWKESTTAAMPFLRLKLRLKPEIVTLGQPGIDPTAAVGTHVDAADWNALVTDPDVAMIDTRNAYEVAIGTFAGAIDPGTAAFTDFPRWWADNRDRLAGKRIAMFCTGGIRCEKSTSYLLSQGVNEVFHLRGGILKYLEQVPEGESLWQGECFVFDERVSVGHGLVQGAYSLCRACRMPLSPEDRADPAYEEGVACPHCAATRSAADRARYRERHRQVALAAGRGRAHIGGGA